MQEIKRFADYVPACESGEFPQIKLYLDADKKEESGGTFVVDKEGALIIFERVTSPTGLFAFSGLSINSSTTEVPDLDWYVEDDAAYLRDSGHTSGGVVTYLYTLSLRGGDGVTVYLDPQLVNTGGSGG